MSLACRRLAEDDSDDLSQKLLKGMVSLATVCRQRYHALPTLEVVDSSSAREVPTHAGRDTFKDLYTDRKMGHLPSKRATSVVTHVV